MEAAGVQAILKANVGQKTENAADCRPPELKPSWWRSAWAEALGLTLLVGLPLIFSAAAIVMPGGPERLACGDDGNIELFTWHVLHGVQLSSIRTHGNLAEHLGPMYFYLLAPLYAIFGCKYAGLQLGAILINLLAIGGILAVARRCGGRAAMLWAALLLARYVRFVSIPWLASVWLPWVVILPFLATVFLCAAVISGRVYCLPAAVFAASFIVQTQLGYTVVLAAAMLLTLLSLVPRIRSRLALGPLESGSLPKAMALAAVILAIVWTPPVIKQIMGMRGRISETIGYFAAQGAGHSWREAGTTLGCTLAAFPAWLAGIDLQQSRIAESFSRLSGHEAIILWLAIPQVVLLPLACLLARRRRRDFDMAIALLAACLVPLGLLSLRHIVGNILYHHVFWMTALGLLNVYVIGGTLLGPMVLMALGRGILPSWPSATRALTVAMLVAVGLISLGNVVAAARDLPRIRGQAFDLYMHDQEDAGIEGGDENDAERFLASAGHWLRAHEVGLYRFRIIGLHRSGVATGMILGLTKQGLRPVLDPWYAQVFLPQDAPPSRRTGGVFLLCSRRCGQQFQERPGLEIVAQSPYAVLLWSSDDAVGEQPGSGDRL